MEPLFFKAENWDLHSQHVELHLHTSMEPLFFKAENNHLPEPGGYDRNTLQWSRFFSKRKIGSGWRDVVLPRDFNGAAFFQSGKCREQFFDQTRRAPLQWSRFFSKRKIPSARHFRSLLN